jgi:hypothetical protein
VHFKYIFFSLKKTLRLLKRWRCSCKFRAPSLSDKYWSTVWDDSLSIITGVDVMMTIFYDFCQFLAKKMAFFSQKPML